jgi:hypothetical protein
MNIDRIDTWVFRVGIAVPLVCVAGLALWHFVSFLAGKLAKKTRVPRLSPEPPSGLGSASTAQGDPELLERACESQTEILADMYLKLAESWQRQGQPQRAIVALQKLIERCPETRQALVARDHLSQLTAIHRRES